MAPTTRSRGAPTASTSKHTLDQDDEALDPPQDDAGSHGEDLDGHGENTSLQSLLRRAFRGAKHIEKENEALRKKVKILEDKLGRVQGSDEVSVQPKSRGRRSSASVPELQRQVQLLQKKTKRLEESKEKYKQKIYRLKMKEVKSEAKELQDDAEFEVGDIANKMRKLLREFHDLIVAPCLDGSDPDNEQCLICLDNLEVKKCLSFPCQHIFCEKCVRRLKPEPHETEEKIRCPTCRTECKKEDFMIVGFDAEEQWDQLVKTAIKWAKIDVRREQDTSEEEEEEEFIDDDRNEASTTASEPVSANPLETSPEPGEQELAVPHTPSRLRRRDTSMASAAPEPEDGHIPNTDPLATAPKPDSPQPEEGEADPGPSTRANQTYAQSPRKDKRKRLEALAKLRMAKKSRH